MAHIQIPIYSVDDATKVCSSFSSTPFPYMVSSARSILCLYVQKTNIYEPDSVGGQDFE